MKSWLITSIAAHGLAAAAVVAFGSRPAEYLVTKIRESAPSDVQSYPSPPLSDSAMTEKWGDIQRLRQALINEHNRRIEYLKHMEKQVHAEIGPALDSAVAHAQIAEREVASVLDNAANQLKLSSQQWNLLAESLHKKAQVSTTKALSESQAALDNLVHAQNRMQQQRRATDEFLNLARWIDHKPTQEKLDRLLAARKRLDELLQAAEKPVHDYAERSREVSGKLPGDGRQPDWFQRRSLIPAFQRLAQSTPTLDSSAETQRHINALLDSLAQEILTRRQQLRFAGSTPPQPSEWTPSRGRPTRADSLLRRLGGIEKEIDSTYFRSQVMDYALAQRIPYKEALQRLSRDSVMAPAKPTVPQYPDRVSLPPQTVEAEDFARILDMVKSSTEKPEWAKKDQTDSMVCPTVSVTRGASADTVDITLNISEDSLMKLAQRMRDVKDTIYVDAQDVVPGRDTTVIPYRISQEQLEMLRRAFPDTVASCIAQTDSTRPDRPGSPPSPAPDAPPRQTIFRLFPNAVVKGPGKPGVCSRAILFCGPSSGGDAGPYPSLLPSMASAGASQLSAKLSWMSQNVRTPGSVYAKPSPRGGAGETQGNLRPLSHTPPLAKSWAADISGHMRGEVGGKGNGSNSGENPGLTRADGDGGGSGPAHQRPPSLSDFGGQVGCKLSSRGKATKWFHIPNWYLLGPFPNDRRKNIATAFPPEYGIDLDASYKGRGGKIIRWEYASFMDYRVVPPELDDYTVYYAYTRVWSDKPNDVWIAIGSDDRSDIWINRQPVWRSSDLHKPWNSGEGMRRIHLKRGDNTFLVRIENGQGAGCFSLLVCTEDS